MTEDILKVLKTVCNLTSQHRHRDPPQWRLDHNDNVTAEVRNDTLDRYHETQQVPSMAYVISETSLS